MASGKQYLTHDFTGKVYAYERIRRILEYVSGRSAVGSDSCCGTDVLGKDFSISFEKAGNNRLEYYGALG